MKVIVTGATGLVGGAVVQYCIKHPEISSIVVLSRREISSELTDDPKVTVIIHEDFLSYPPELLEKLNGAVACLWALGLRGAPLGYKDAAYAEMVDVQYPVAAAKAFIGALTPHLQGSQKFRFVLCSGIGAEMDQSKSFWMMQETRMLKGRVEKQLLEIQVANPTFEAFTCRPFGILPEKPNVFFKFIFTTILTSVKATELAALMMDLGLHGHNQWIWENEQIGRQGAEILALQK